MSINVTVTGNPVSIKRGRMVTACTCKDAQKEEFERRRLMRLEQVRQQSKEIAENVRNKVRNEKKKQLSASERENEKKLKDWQTRKLFELQNQYQESLKDIGLAHKEAELINKIEDDARTQAEYQSKIAAERGKLARRRLQNSLVSSQQRNQSRRDFGDAEKSHKYNCGNKCWCKCNPNKHFYTVVDANGEGTPVQVSLRSSSRSQSPSSSAYYKATGHVNNTIEELSEATSSSNPEKLQDNSSDTSERMSKEISGVSGGSSPRRFDQEVEKSRQFSQILRASNERQFGSQKADDSKVRKSRVESPPTSVKPTQKTQEEKKVASGKRGSKKTNKNQVANTKSKGTIVEKSSVKEFGSQYEQDNVQVPTASRLRDSGTQDMPNVAEGAGEKRAKRAGGGRGDDNREPQTITVKETSEKYARSHSDDQTSPQRLLEKTTRTSTTIQYPVETRISDRIKHRSGLVTNPDPCDTISDELIKETSRRTIHSDPDLVKPIRKDTSTQMTPTRVQKQQNANLEDIEEVPEDPPVLKQKKSKESQPGRSSNPADIKEIPEKPLVVLKQKKSSGVDDGKGHVERIEDEQLEMVPDDKMEEQFLKKMERQDREAEERGKIAMQKEKTKRSYEEMMKKLPIVQRQERLNRLSSDKPEYYMTEERLKEVEGKRQSEMENAFEQAFPGLKPNLITTEEVGKVRNKPTEIASWDVVEPGTQKGGCECCPNQTKREKQLRDLLLNLQTQKELLLQEVDSLPKDSKLDELLGSLHDISTKRKPSKSRRSTEKRRPLRETSPTSSSSSLPVKKSKTKCKRCILIRQNMSTQTSPVTEKAVEVPSVERVERATSPAPIDVEDKKQISKKTDPIGGGDDDKVCEIVIKIRENEVQPEIVINSNEKKVTQTAVPKEKKRKDKKIETTNTWSEHFSHNSTNFPSSSTSYYSPPDAPVCTRPSRLRDVLQDKQKQTNFATRCTSTTTPCRASQTTRKLHPFIVKYIEKLLTISRSAVEELSVSSVSDVTTPTASITETTTNNPQLVQLKKLLKRLGITYEELRENYGKKHEAVLSSLSTTPANSGHEISHRVDSCDCVTQNEQTNTNLSARVSQEDVSVGENDEEYQEMMRRYAEITDCCNRKINDLTEKIEKVRMEKMQIINNSHSSSGNEKENTTTAYLDLVTTDTSTSGEQEKLDKMLLTIDQNLAENLKRMSSSEIREKYTDKQLPDDLDADLRDRYEKLMTVEEDFEPLLKDIPKLPKFTETTCDSTKCSRRPPPSKGLTVAKRFNEQITTIPHELSTILEGDSQVSTKVQKANESKSIEISTPDILKEIAKASPKKQVTVKDQIDLSSSSDEYESLERMLKDMGMGWAIATLRKTQEALALTSSSSSVEFNIQHKATATDSSGSEVSLKSVLSRHLLTKISSTTTTISEANISALLKDFEDISAILGSGSTTKEGHRTSTPIQPVSDQNKQCACSDRSGSGKGNCSFHSLQSNSSISR